MTYQVWVQRFRDEAFISTGVTETNDAQLANWKDICMHYGWQQVRFIPLESEYSLTVRPRSYRIRHKRREEMGLT